MSRADIPALSARAASVAASPVREILALTAQPEVISFAGGLPAPELFDVAGLRRAYAEVLANAPDRALQYSATEGDPGLRRAVAARLDGRGLPTDADDLLVTTGSQQALTLVASALLEPGDVVLVEDPGYLASLQCFGFAGARVVPVTCDEHGTMSPMCRARRSSPGNPMTPRCGCPSARTPRTTSRRACADSPRFSAYECPPVATQDVPDHMTEPATS
jgi:DNA-binding transcriptional MocR family regulator